MKKNLTLLFLIFSFNSFSQNAAVLSSSDFKNMRLNGVISIDNLENEVNYISKLSSLFGPANDTDCNTNDITGTGCIINYAGLKLGFDYDTELFDITLTNPNYFIEYGPYQMKTGMDLSELQTIFPSAYNKRYTVASGSKTLYVINLYIGNSSSDTTFTFLYEPVTSKVTEININYQLN